LCRAWFVLYEELYFETIEWDELYVWGFKRAPFIYTIVVEKVNIRGGINKTVKTRKTTFPRTFAETKNETRETF